MQTAITSAQLLQYRTALENGQMSVGQFYDAMLKQGYEYAGWAASVARGNEFAGVAARDYLKETALMGAGGDACRELTQAQLDQIVRDCATGYLSTLEGIAKDSGGILNRDVTFNETEVFHKKAFEDNHLTIENWTLKIPMDLIRLTQGDAAVEKIWQDVRDTGGTGPDAFLQNMWISYRVGLLMSSTDPEIARRAKEWVDQAPGLANMKAISKIFETFGKVPSSVYVDPFSGMPYLGEQKGISEIYLNNTVNLGVNFNTNVFGASTTTDPVHYLPQFDSNGGLIGYTKAESISSQNLGDKILYTFDHGITRTIAIDPGVPGSVDVVGYYTSYRVPNGVGGFDELSIGNDLQRVSRINADGLRYVAVITDLEVDQGSERTSQFTKTKLVYDVATGKLEKVGVTESFTSVDGTKHSSVTDNTAQILEAYNETVNTNGTISTDVRSIILGIKYDLSYITDIQGNRVLARVNSIDGQIPANESSTREALIASNVDFINGENIAEGATILYAGSDNPLTKLPDITNPNPAVYWTDKVNIDNQRGQPRILFPIKSKLNHATSRTH